MNRELEEELKRLVEAIKSFQDACQHSRSYGGVDKSINNLHKENKVEFYCPDCQKRWSDTQ